MEDEMIVNDEPMIYTGPNIFPLAMQKFQVFSGGLPPYVERAIEKIPEIKALIVPVSELENMRTKIEKSGTREARIFYNVEKEAEKIRSKRK
ncbi:MAG: hypothetical protein IJ859_09485 [Synergistaceae bacterium]|nr:hypothetical protein [Synergistaceae bacterium]